MVFKNYFCIMVYSSAVKHTLEIISCCEILTFTSKLKTLKHDETLVSFSCFNPVCINNQAITQVLCVVEEIFLGCNLWCCIDIGFKIA